MKRRMIFACRFERSAVLGAGGTARRIWPRIWSPCFFSFLFFSLSFLFLLFYFHLTDARRRCMSLLLLLLWCRTCQPNMWLHPFFCMCVKLYIVWCFCMCVKFFVLQLVQIRFCQFWCSVFLLVLPLVLPMKISPNIMQAPPMWSNSLYFHNGCSIGKRNNSKAAHVHFRRILTANRDMSVIKAKLASDQQLGPTPAVRLKSKWQRKWDELQDTVTPHQMVDMQLARRIFRLNIWTWEKERIAAGSCLRSVFI